MDTLIDIKTYIEIIENEKMLIFMCFNKGVDEYGTF